MEIFSASYWLKTKIRGFFLSGVLVLLMDVVVTIVFFHLSCFLFFQMPCSFIIFLGDPFSWKLVESYHFYIMFIGLCRKHFLVHFQIFSVSEMCYWILEYVQDKEKPYTFIFFERRPCIYHQIDGVFSIFAFCFWSSLWDLFPPIFLSWISFPC